MRGPASTGNRALRCGIAALAVLLVGAPPVAGAPETYALVSGQDANGFPFMSDHHAAGVSQTSFDRIVGTAGIAADATADFGDMHLRSEARSFQVGMPMFIAGASTFWQDDLTITGGNGSGGGGITVRL